MARGYRESGEGIQTAGKKADGGATAMRSKRLPAGFVIPAKRF
jgi:hypothetical protein